MRVAFAGTPEFAATALERIRDAGFEIPLVLTQPDRPAGRGRRLTASPVKELALELGLPLAQPVSLREPTEPPSDRPDLLVVVAYGHIVGLRAGKV